MIGEGLGLSVLILQDEFFAIATEGAGKSLVAFGTVVVVGEDEGGVGTEIHAYLLVGWQIPMANQGGFTLVAGFHDFLEVAGGQFMIVIGLALGEGEGWYAVFVA